ESWPMVSSDVVSSTVRAPRRAAATAASVPAWPPPITHTSKSCALRDIPLIYRSDKTRHHTPTMPIPVTTNASTLLFQKAAFEKAGLTRTAIDGWLNLTPEEFRVEGELIAVGPI